MSEIDLEGMRRKLKESLATFLRASGVRKVAGLVSPIIDRIERVERERDEAVARWERAKRSLFDLRDGLAQEEYDFSVEEVERLHSIADAALATSPPAPADPSEVERMAMQDLARWIHNEFDRGAGHPSDESIDARFEDILASYEMADEARERRGEA